MQYRTKKTLLSFMFLSVIGVSGCGQKRPLYLPEVPAENKLPTATSEQTQSHSSKEQS